MLPLVMGSDEGLMLEARGSLEKYIDPQAPFGIQCEVLQTENEDPSPLCIHPSFTQQYTLPLARLCARVRVIKLSNTWPLPFRSLSKLERNFKDFLFPLPRLLFLSCLYILTHPSEFSHESPPLKNKTCSLLLPLPATPFLSCPPQLDLPWCLTW